jgi:hypothetical protein
MCKIWWRKPTPALEALLAFKDVFYGLYLCAGHYSSFGTPLRYRSFLILVCSMIPKLGLSTLHSLFS